MNPSQYYKYEFGYTTKNRPLPIWSIFKISNYEKPTELLMTNPDQRSNK